MHMLFSFVNYRLKAKSLHGVHSPFVYKLSKEVVRAKGAQRMDAIEQLRRELLDNEAELRITDLGAGSRSRGKNQRSIAQIARYSPSRKQDAAFLQRLIRHLNAGNVLELGTNLGLTTAYLAAAPHHPQIWSIEGDPALAAMARLHMEQLQLEATVVADSFEHALPDVLKDMRRVDFAFLDGNHKAAPTLHYYDAIQPFLHEHSCIAIGDIHWSADMQGAWKALYQKPEVTVSIDLFYMGLLFFRKGKAHEHFLLKYP